MAYTIMINETQRLALLEVIKAAPKEILEKYEDLITNGPALEYWEEMLSTLPEDEAAHPGVVHGFCI